ncbi:MAG: TIM barrel protein [Acutalibacter sp.]|nr:TIM barrel protein [Acutalibacter sp.]
MKAAYTGWTWIASREPEEAKKQLEQSFKECKFLGYDTVENFAFIRDFFAENPQELVDMTKRCGVELVNLYGHFTLDVEESLRIAMEQVDFLSAIGGKWYNCQHGGFGEEPYERPTNPEMLDKICEISNRLGEYAKGKGVTVCFHPHFGTCVFSQSDIDYFAAHTKPEYVSFCLDTAHTTLAGINPAALIRQYGDRIAFMHLKDVDTYALSKAEGRDKMASFRALGHGTVDFPAVKAALVT